MKKGLKKFIKGMFGIFVIKLTILAVVLTYQACQTEEFTPEDTQVKENFLASLRKSSQLSSKIKYKNEFDTSNLSLRSTDQGLLEVTDEETLICVTSEVKSRIEDNNLDDDITLVDFIDVEIETVDENIQIEEVEYCFRFGNSDSETAISDPIIEAKNFLYTRGFTDQDIDEMIAEENGSEEDLVPTVMLILEDERATAYNNKNKFKNYPSLFFSSANAQSWTDIGRCAAAAIGADIAYALAVEGGGKSDKWKKKAIKKLFGKVAKRMLGPVGVALAIISFSTCLYAS